MGLGKTLQGVALVWVILTSGAPVLGGNPIGKRAVIVCPTSLVSNWEGELGRWLQVRVHELP
jgi:DNA repair and recombination protein RAD54 and RAD54-like protein